MLKLISTIYGKVILGTIVTASVVTATVYPIVNSSKQEEPVNEITNIVSEISEQTAGENQLEEPIIETENIIEEEETIEESNTKQQATSSQEPILNAGEGTKEEIEKLPAIQQAVNPPASDVIVKFSGYGLEYNQTLKKVIKYSTGTLVYDRDQWLNKVYPKNKQELLMFIEGARTVDINNGNYPREYCQQQVNTLNTAINTAKGALEYFKSSGMETSSETFQYGGSWFVQSEEVINSRISLLQEEKAEWQTRLNSAPTYGPEEAQKRNYYSELERAYNYISTH